MRILALLEANSITGTAKAVLEFAREATATQVHVANFARGPKPSPNALTSALVAHNVPLHLIQEKGRFDSAVLARIRQLVVDLNPDVVWTNSVKSHFLVHLSGVSRHRKWVAFHHGYTATDFKMQLYNQLDRISLRHAHRTLTVCQPFAQQMMQRGVSRARIRVQHMPIRPFDLDRNQVRQLRADLKLTDQTQVLLTIGRLSREKGQSDLLKAFASVHRQNPHLNLALVIVGDGPESITLRQLAAQSGARDAIYFTGHRDDAANFYGLADIFVLPSHSEGTPNVLLESMAAHVPVIATEVGGVPELCTNRENSLLVPKKDSGALAFAIQTLLDSAELGETLAKSAEAVVRSHSPQLYCRSLLSIFEETIQVR